MSTSIESVLECKVALRRRVLLTYLMEYVMSIRSVLIKRDGYSPEEADALIAEAKDEMYNRLSNGDMESAYDICEEYFGLEPDYLDELI